MREFLIFDETMRCRQPSECRSIAPPEFQLFNAVSRKDHGISGDVFRVR
jgi:hypothetical protein